jgi:hypothetical protein
LEGFVDKEHSHLLLYFYPMPFNRIVPSVKRKRFRHTFYNRNSFIFSYLNYFFLFPSYFFLGCFRFQREKEREGGRERESKRDRKRKRQRGRERGGRGREIRKETET